MLNEPHFKVADGQTDRDLMTIAAQDDLHFKSLTPAEMIRINSKDSTKFASDWLVETNDAPEYDPNCLERLSSGKTKTANRLNAT